MSLPISLSFPRGTLERIVQSDEIQRLAWTVKPPFIADSAERDPGSRAGRGAVSGLSQQFRTVNCVQRRRLIPLDRDQSRRNGEPPDRIFVVAAGSAGVLCDGER